MYYFLTCLAALFVSVAIFRVYHRAFHRWNPSLNPIGYCENQLHEKGFGFFGTLAFAPFLLTVFISPGFLEYQKWSSAVVYKEVGGEYQRVAWATRDDSAVLSVPLGEHEPRTGFVFHVVSDGGKIREATVGIGFRYDPDPEVFERIFRAGGYDSGHNFGSPKIKRFVHGFMIRNEDEIEKLVKSVDLNSPTAREEFKREMGSFVDAHLQHPGMVFRAYWVDIREF